MKWTHLTTAPDQLVGEMWCALLEEDGVSAVIRPGDTTSYFGVTVYPCGILVREHQRERAKELLETHLGREID